MPAGSTTGGQRRLGGTMREDAWWLELVPAVALLGAFGIYATLRAFEGTYYEWGPYLSPFYSPLIDSHHRWWPFSPALLILIWPLGFRVTCYYYRKAYYRAFWRAPAACAVREPHASYSGETRFPLILQNLHRYFFYVVILISVLNTYDMVQAFRGPNGSFGFGLGSLIMLVNVVLLWAYTLSCHSCRHITGGRLKNFSKHPARYWAWTQVSKLNARHMQLAWTTLGTLMLTDLYILLVASGTISDLRFFN